jgi:TrpR family trp operon transcriptional repressor
MNIDDPRVNKNITELAKALAMTDNRALVRDFLYCLLTPAEIADIAARWALVKALKQKIPQREIAKDLGISLCKITRGSRELKKPDSAFMRIFSLQEKTNAK